jgi:hypothetical protein
MRRSLLDKVEAARIRGPEGYPAGAFVFKHGNATLRCIVSDGGGWDHVSVSLHTRCPTWDEMAFVKSLFFDDEEVVMQLHPAKSQYVNHFQFCLHLWRPQTAAEMEAIKRCWEQGGEEYPYPVESPGAIPIPPIEFVGPR